MTADTPLIKLFDDVLQHSDEKDEVEFQDVLEAMETRGFGALIILPSLITMLPTGAIPGIPAMCGVFIMLISGQIVVGKKQPWLPQKLKKQAISKDKFKHGLEKAKPYLKTMSSYIGKRFTILTGSIIQRLSALLIMVLCAMIIGVGFIPFAAFFMAAPILLFGLGFTFRDGIITSIAFIMTLACFIGIPYFAINN